MNEKIGNLKGYYTLMKNNFWKKYNRSTNRFYITYFLLFVCGTIWIWTKGKHHNDLSFCLPRILFEIPCPACGTTRSLLHVFRGDWSEAFYSNPLGYVLFFILIISFVLFLYDIIAGKQILYRTKYIFLNLLSKPVIFVPAIFLTILNWIWNLYKYL